MANTYKLISSVTVGAGGTSTISFSSIPQTYTDLVLHLSVRSDRASGDYGGLNVTLNNYTGTLYYMRTFYAYNSTPYGAYNSSLSSGDYNGPPQATQTASIFGNTKLYFPSYTNSTLPKCWSSDSANENNGAMNYMSMQSNLLDYVADAITSIQIKTNSGNSNFVQYSTAYLYGIKNS